MAYTSTFSDPSIALPSLWLGTSMGAILTVSLNLPENDIRKTESVQVSFTGIKNPLVIYSVSKSNLESFINPNLVLVYKHPVLLYLNFFCLFCFVPGPMFRLKGTVLSMSLLDCNGALIPYAFESWKDDAKEGKEKRDSTYDKLLSEN